MPRIYDPRVADEKRHLADIYRETRNAVMDGSYISASGNRVLIGDDSAMVNNSRFYSRPFDVTSVPPHGEHTVVEVVNDDSIYAGKRLLDEGHNPIVLNFANQYKAGGGVISGCRAQEEDLFRRTNLFRSLYSFTPVAWKYDLRQSHYQYPMDDNFGGVYTPYAKVLRDGKTNDYAFLDTPYELSFVAVAAICRPPLEDGRIARHLVPTVKNKIRTILRIGLKHGHDAIVLGAFGCGAFQNPPKHMAELFKEVMEEDELRDKYRKIVFAILENHHAGENHNPNGNLLPFLETFPGQRAEASE